MHVIQAVSPSSNQQHSKSPRSPSPEVSPVHETQQRVELHSRGSDASANIQATDAAMKALRNDSTWPDPATFDFGEPQPEYGGGFDDEENPNEQFEDDGATNGFEQEERSTISRSPSPVNDSASLRQDSLPLPIPSKTKANSTTRSTGKELPQPRSAFIGVEVPSHRERSMKKQVAVSKDSSRSRKSTPPESLSDRRKSPSPPIASTSAAVHPLSPVTSIEDQDQDRELSAPLRSRPSPVVYRSRHRSTSASTQPQPQPQGLDSSSSEVRSPPPKRRPAKGGQKIKKNPKQVETAQLEASNLSPSPIEAKEESVEVEIEKVENKPISKRAKGKGKTVEQLIPFDADEDEIGYSPRAVLAHSKRRPSLSKELTSTSQKPQKSRKLRQSTPPASSSPRKHHLKNGLNDSGHSQSESFASRQSRTAQLANSRKANQKTPVLSSPHRQNSQARSSSRGTGSSSRPQRTIKNASEWWQVGGGSGVKRERAESDFEGDGDDQEENVVEEEVVPKKRGKPQKKKAKKVVAEEVDLDRSQQVPKTRKRKSVDLDDDEEEEEDQQQSQSPSQVDEAYQSNPASDRDETPPVASTSGRPAAAKKKKAPAPAPKKRKRKSIVYKPKAKKKEPVSPRAPPKQKKKVVPAEEKLSRASGVKAQRKRVAAAERGRGKKKNFEESESEESEEWDGE